MRLARGRTGLRKARGVSVARRQRETPRFRLFSASSPLALFVPQVWDPPGLRMAVFAAKPLLSVFRRCEALLDGFEVRGDLRIALTQRFDAAHGAHDCGVVAIAEGAPELREAALEALAA